jgi:hypothetical protein
MPARIASMAVAQPTNALADHHRVTGRIAARGAACIRHREG